VHSEWCRACRTDERKSSSKSGMSRMTIPAENISKFKVLWTYDL
jgi:hypothetical protein